MQPVSKRATAFLLILVLYMVSQWPLGMAEPIEANEHKAGKQEATMAKVRKAAVAGYFYDGNASRLKEQIRSYLKRATPEPLTGQLIALISPHAGYRFSGQAAAFGYKLFDRNRVNRVMILAPSHRVGFRGVSIPDVGSYETPLGLVPLDRKSCDVLLRNPLFMSIPEVHGSEHSLEVQLPFLQEVLGAGLKLIPLVVGQLEGYDYSAVADILKRILETGDVVIVSSDFTHQGPRFGYVPYKKNIRENIEKLDMGAVDQILKKDGKGFLAYGERTGATICGRCPIAILMEMLPEDANGKLLTYYTSGDITGDHTDTVSYVSLAFSSPAGWPRRR